MITSYKELPIGAYEKILAIADRKLPEEEQNVLILAILTGRPEDELLALPVTEFRDLMDGAEFLLRPAEPETLKRSYKLGEFTLVPCRDFRKMTAGQFIAFRQFHRAGDAFTAERLSTLLVPKGKDYGEGYDSDAVVEAIRTGLPYADALALSAFFLDRWMNSLDAILAYSRIEAKRMKRRGIPTPHLDLLIEAAAASRNSSRDSLLLTESARLCVALGRNVRG